MIVKMKKVTLVVSSNEKRNMLSSLRKAGVVHVQNIAVAQGDKLKETENKISDIMRAIEIVQKTDVHKPEHAKSISEETLLQEAHQTCLLDDERAQDKKELNELDEKMSFFRPWGSFNPNNIRMLAEKGVHVNFYLAPKKELKNVQAIEGVKVINKKGQHIYFVHLSYQDNKCLAYKQANLPKEDYEALYNKHKEAQTRIKDIEVLIDEKARIFSSMKKFLLVLEEKRNFFKVEYGMQEEGVFSCLQGFLPQDNQDQVREIAAKGHVGLMIEDPKETDEVPTLIKTPKWVSIIQPVFKFMGTVPGYKEYDISMWFLLFFSLFFAMLIGDAGYGLVFFSLTAVCNFKFKKAPKQAFFLMYVLSISTMIWGVITGTYFGSEQIAAIPFLNKMIIPEISSFNPVGDSQSLMIYICFCIGVVQLCIGRLIVAVKLFPSMKVIGQIGWMMTLVSLFFLAGNLVLGNALPSFFGGLFLTGFLLILFFANFQKNIIKGALGSMSNLPLDVIGRFSDVVSYIRLFAVGYASVIVANSFNNMGLALGFNNILTGFGAALIIFFGHTLNIALGLMAIIVHGVRLNMLEFSGQMGMEWAGKEFSPFEEKEEIDI